MTNEHLSSDKIKLLAAFAFERLTDSSYNAMTANELAAELDEKLSDHELPDVHFTSGEMATAAEMLFRHNLIRKHEYRYTKTRYEAMADSRNRLTGAEEFAEELALFVRLSFSWLREALENIPSDGDTTGTIGEFELELSGDSIGNTRAQDSEGAFRGGTFQSVDEDQNHPVPASDRYVSVRDNQTSFDELFDQLTRIKNEYERDHNHLGAEPDCLNLLSEVEATLAQIKHGAVRLGQLAHGLIPTFEQACLGLAAYPGFVLLLGDAVNTAQQILRFFGFL